MSELSWRARDFRLRMAVIDREVETTLDTTRDRHGRTIHHHAAAAARARRNQAAMQAYATCLAPHADELLDAAHRALDELPPARHTTGWRTLLYSLATSHTEIMRVLNRPAVPGSAAEREQHTTVWPRLTAWADHGYIATDLAGQRHQPEAPLTGEEQQMWTEMAQAAQRRGELDLIESWYAADGRPITLAYLVEDDTSTVIALAGDPDAPGWQVIGHYRNEYEAGQSLPPAVPPGVLRPDVSRFNRPEPAPEVSLQELLRDVVEARAAGDVSEALLTATQHGHDAGPMVRLQELLDTAGQFAHALETVQGRQIAARLAALGRQVDFLTREVHEAAEDLGATVAVLPPHRTPRPRIRPRPALDTTPPSAPSRTSAPTRHR
ncbi:hypothetical protein [Streptomyces chromofuscus]|uniref:Uncharacterized protein n=1 Tax=Streptomyces chromofuscus TaxID=42881 RepID=A0A7M2T2T0_STRCW|nr:hypothetical protein [Streptomyces chromofuscus]QOV42997.1 hypothetical protein IPT68_24885 [Streptomyces chromofuscus]GGS92844.1 hypothetical protein GCM10010254_10960 [Streptomyces chromofuscus]